MKVSFCFCSTAILTCLIYIAERGGNMLLSFCYTMIGLVLFYMMAVVKKFILSKPPGRCRLILQGVCNTFALSQAACQRRYQCDHRTCRPGDPASSWSPNSTVLHLDIYLCKYSNLNTQQGYLLSSQTFDILRMIWILKVKIVLYTTFVVSRLLFGEVDAYSSQLYLPKLSQVLSPTPRPP